MMMGFLKKLGYKKEQKPTKIHSINEDKILDKKTIVKNLLAIVLNDEHLSVPVYLHGMKHEDQANYLGNLYPLQYV